MAHNAYATLKSERAHTTWLIVLRDDDDDDAEAADNNGAALLPQLQPPIVTLRVGETLRLFCALRRRRSVDGSVDGDRWSAVGWTHTTPDGTLVRRLAAHGQSAALVVVRNVTHESAAGVYNCSTSDAHESQVMCSVLENRYERRSEGARSAIDMQARGEPTMYAFTNNSTSDRYSHNSVAYTMCAHLVDTHGAQRT